LSASIPAKFCGRARRDAAAFYLSQLARGVLSGEMVVVAGERQMALATSEFLLLDIEVKQSRRANSVEIRLRWSTRNAVEASGPLGSGNGL
jgi:amphi-Trp domain-containing protein